MAALTTPARAPLNDEFQYFIANIDYYTTAAQVEEFFSQFGNVNHVKLLPPQPPQRREKQLHRGYGFVFMLDEESCINVDQFVSAFPENKITMLGRKGVHVKRQRGVGRGGGGGSYDPGNDNHWNDGNDNAAGAGNNLYHPSWAQYYGYTNMQPHQVGGTPSYNNPQHMAYYPANYYTNPTTTVTVGPSGQAQPYSQPAMVSSTIPYTQPQQQQQQQQQQYLPPPPSQQQQQQLPPHYDPYANNNPQMHHQQQPPYQTQPPIIQQQHPLPPPPPPQQQQQQQQQQQAYGGHDGIPLPPNNNSSWGPGSTMNNGGGRSRGSEGGGGGGKWQHPHQDNNNNNRSAIGGGRGSLNGYNGRGGGGDKGRNGRDGRMDRPY